MPDLGQKIADSRPDDFLLVGGREEHFDRLRQRFRGRGRRPAPRRQPLDERRIDEVRPDEQEKRQAGKGSGEGRHAEAPARRASSAAKLRPIGAQS